MRLLVGTLIGSEFGSRHSYKVYGREFEKSKLTGNVSSQRPRIERGRRTNL